MGSRTGGPSDRHPGTVFGAGRQPGGYSPRAGFTITELIIAVTLAILLTALAAGAYSKLVNVARVAKSANLVATLATAKSMFVADSKTTPAQIAAFNTHPEGNFATIAPYIRINGATPRDMNDLLSLSGIPSSGVTVTIGAVDDGTSSGGSTGQAPTVTGYGYPTTSPTPGS